MLSAFVSLIYVQISPERLTLKDPKTGQTTKSRSAVAAPLVPATGIPALTQNRAIVFLNMPRYTTDPLKLAKTRAFDDPRFTGLLDPVPPVGPTG